MTEQVELEVFEITDEFETKVISIEDFKKQAAAAKRKKNAKVRDLCPIEDVVDGIEMDQFEIIEE
jgi:hypothetical protein